MKVTEIKRLPDYVRFGFNVTVEVGNNLVVHAYPTGSLETIDGTMYVIPSVEDIDWEKVEFFGKEVKFKEFKEMYNTLFKEDFKELEKRVDNMVIDAIHREIPNTLYTATLTTKEKLFRIRYKYLVDNNLLGAMHHNGYLVEASNDWSLLRIAESLGAFPTSCSHIYNHKGEKLTYCRRALTIDQMKSLLQKV